MEKERDKQYFLCFDNYQKVMCHNFNEFLRKQLFVNVTLVCAGAELRAHQCILSACSPLFESILTNTPHTHPILIFNDISKEVMGVLLAYMYKGEVHISQSFLPDVLEAAKKLKIRGLQNMDNNISKESSTIFGTNGYQNCLDTLPSQQEQTLRSSSTQYLSAPATLNAGDPEKEQPRLPTTVSSAISITPIIRTRSPTPVPAHSISSPTVYRNSPRDVSGKVRNPFARKSEDSDTTFSEDDVAMPGPSKVPTVGQEELPQDATNNNDSDIEFIEQNPPPNVVVPDTQEVKDTPSWYCKQPRYRLRAKPIGQSVKVEYKSDGSDLMSPRKKSRKTPIMDSSSEEEHSRVVNPLALKSKDSEKEQSEVLESIPKKNLLAKKRKLPRKLTEKEFLETSISDLGYFCVICFKFYKDNKAHVRNMHNNNKGGRNRWKLAISCDKCFKKFDWKKFLDIHVCNAK